MKPSAHVVVGTIMGVLLRAVALGQGYAVKAELLGPDGVPIRSALLELRPEKNGKVGKGMPSGATGTVVIPSILPGRYELSIEAAGFDSLSRTINIDVDLDLGRIVMDADPNVVRTSSACCLGVSNPSESEREAAHTEQVHVGTRPLIVRGLIQPLSIFNDGRRLTVQLSCSKQFPGRPPESQTDVARTSVDGEGVFEVAVPSCSDETLAHWELRFSLRDEHGAVRALLVPKMTAEGYHQSRFGIWLPLKLMVEQVQAHEAIFFPEFTDDRPLQAKISVHPWKDRFVAGENMFMNSTFTNTSDEVLSVPFGFDEPDSAWIITDEKGIRTPSRPLPQRSAQVSHEARAPYSRLLFPGEIQTETVNISSFFTLDSPGTYHVLARRTVGRPEVAGAARITSAESTFVIAPLTVCEVVKDMNRYDRKSVTIRTLIHPSDDAGLLLGTTCHDQIRLEPLTDSSLLTDTLYQSLHVAIANQGDVEATVSGRFEIVLDVSGGRYLTLRLHKVLSVSEADQR